MGGLGPVSLGLEPVANCRGLPSWRAARQDQVRLRQPAFAKEVAKLLDRKPGEGGQLHVADSRTFGQTDRHSRRYRHHGGSHAQELLLKLESAPVGWEYLRG